MAMPLTPQELKFQEDFIERTRQARVESGLKQQQVCDILGIDQGRYSKYEKRSPLPHHMVGRFCLVCRVSSDWLYYGGHKKTVIPDLDESA